MASTTSSSIVRAAPGSGRVHQAVEAFNGEALPHFDTVIGLQPSSAAVSAWVQPPSAHADTIRDRNANPRDELCRRAQRCNVSPSPTLKEISTVGRPRRAMVSLRCWSTTPDERGSTAKFPSDQDFLAEQPSGRLGGKTDAVGAQLRQSIRGLDFGGEPVEIGDVRLVGPELDITE